MCFPAVYVFSCPVVNLGVPETHQQLPVLPLPSPKQYFLWLMVESEVT